MLLLYFATRRRGSPLATGAHAVQSTTPRCLGADRFFWYLFPIFFVRTCRSDIVSQSTNSRAVNTQMDAEDQPSLLLMKKIDEEDTVAGCRFDDGRGFDRGCSNRLLRLVLRHQIQISHHPSECASLLSRNPESSLSFHPDYLSIFGGKTTVVGFLLSYR
jgi:hypothetical protein